MAIKKATAGIVRVPLRYYAFDEAGFEVTEEGGEQKYDTYVAELRRRSDREAKDREFDAAIDQTSRDILTDFCNLVLEVKGFEDFPPYTPETVSDVAFEYFNDPYMIEFVEQFMLGYQRRTMPVDFFRRFSPGSLEVPRAQ